MTVDQNTIGGVAVFSVSGTMWIGGWDVYETIKTLIEKGIKRVVVDLAHLRLLNSIGIGVLVASLKAIRDVGGDLCISGANENILTVLRVVNLYTIMQVFATQEEAVAAMQPS